jgi:hypothetical protein
VSVTCCMKWTWGDSNPRPSDCQVSGSMRCATPNGQGNETCPVIIWKIHENLAGGLRIEGGKICRTHHTSTQTRRVDISAHSELWRNPVPRLRDTPNTPVSGQIGNSSHNHDCYYDNNNPNPQGRPAFGGRLEGGFGRPIRPKTRAALMPDVPPVGSRVTQSTWVDSGSCEVCEVRAAIVIEAAGVLPHLPLRGCMGFSAVRTRKTRRLQGCCQFHADGAVCRCNITWLGWRRNKVNRIDPDIMSRQVISTCVMRVKEAGKKHNDESRD